MQTFHLIRHAQSEHNLAAQTATSDPMIRDARLTPYGHQQAKDLGAEIGAGKEFDLIVVSPFTRTIQTATHAFAQARAPWTIQPLAREWLDSYCDVGSSPTDMAKAYPHLDFSHLDDPWWYVEAGSTEPYVKEPREHLMARIETLVSWLKARPEQTIAVVAHGGLLRALTGQPFANAQRLITSL